MTFIKKITLFILCTVPMINTALASEDQQAAVHKMIDDRARKVAQEELAKNHKNTALSNYKNTALSFEKKQKYQELLLAPLDTLTPTAQEAPLVEILQATIALSDEFKQLHPDQISVDDMIALDIPEYTFVSKAGSYGLLAPCALISLLLNGKYATPNKITVQVQESSKYDNSYQININTQGSCEYIEKELKACHNKFTKTLREVSNHTYHVDTMSALTTASHLSESEQIPYIQNEFRLQGTIAGICYWYGCNKSIEITCSKDILKNIIQQKNSSKHKKNSLL